MTTNIGIAKESSSRRSFFTTAASVLGAGAAVSAIGVKLQGQTTTPPVTDISILNYALALENLEAAFYNQGLARFSASDFNTASFANLLGTKIVSKAYTSFQNIRDTENTHVATLNSVIKSLGGKPAAPCTYNFGYKTIDDFVKTAAALENTGVSAYDGAVAMLQDSGLKTAAATIATVEARHASFLNLLNGAIPFPDAFDTPKSMADILAIAGQFIIACPTPAATAITMAVAGPKNLTSTQRDQQLNGDASTSADGKALTYSWRVVSGSAGIYGGQISSPTAQFSGGAGPYTFELTVTDSTGVMSKDTVTINYAGR